MARIDSRFDKVDSRFDEVEARFEMRFAQMETAIERAVATSIRWTVGISFGLYGLMLALILFVVSRELARA